MKLTDIDEKIASAYLPTVIMPVKYAENGVLFWFPGAGMTTILRDIFRSQKLLSQALGKQAGQIAVIELFGHLADKKNETGLMKSAGFSDFFDLKRQTSQLLESGQEIVIVLARIDDYLEKERLTILKSMIKLNALNPRRIHILFNSVDKPWFMQALAEYSELLVLANRIGIASILKDDLLIDYAKQRSSMFDSHLSDSELSRAIDTYGGILQLTKEFVRSNRNSTSIELKFKIIWNRLPESYRKVLQKQISGTKQDYADEALADLERFGVMGLKVFERHKQILDIDSHQLLQELLTPGELRLWEYLNTHQNELIDRNQVTELLRTETAQDISLWAIDKAVSRFRAKLAKSGIDPDLFKTVKKKGYIWQR